MSSTTTTPAEKKTPQTPEEKLNHGLTNRAIDCVRAYLFAQTGKNVILTVDARKALKARLRDIAVRQDAKFSFIQTAFGRKRNWNTDYIAYKAAGKRPLRVFGPIVKTVQKAPTKPKIVKAKK